MPKLASFCKAYCAGYTNAGCYQIHNNWYWKFGYWLGKRAFTAENTNEY